MAKAAITLEELSPAVRAAVRARMGCSRLTKARSFTREHERRHALHILAEIADLTQAERRRVLSQAMKVNAV